MRSSECNGINTCLESICSALRQLHRLAEKNTTAAAWTCYYFLPLSQPNPFFYWMHIFHSGNYYSTQSQSAQAEAVIFRCIVHSTSQFQIFCCQLGSMFVQIYPIFLLGTYFWVPAIDLHCMTTGRYESSYKDRGTVGCSNNRD